MATEGDSILSNFPHLEAANLLANLSLDSQPKTAEIPEPTEKGTYCSNETVMYHQGYGYTPFGAYYSSNSPVPSISHDAQLYGTPHYQYPNPFYQPLTSTGTLYSPNQANTSQGDVPPTTTADKVPLSGGTATGIPDNVVNTGSINRNYGPRPFKPINQNLSSNLNSSFRRGGLPVGFPSPGYQNQRFGYDGFQQPATWMDTYMYSNGHYIPATSTGFSSPLNLHPTRPTSGLGQASGFTNVMRQNNRMYGQYGIRGGAGYGSFNYNSWTNGREWVVVDSKCKPRGRAFGNENVDGLSELIRGPRAKGFKNQNEFGPVTQIVEDHNLPQIPGKEQYNREDFPADYSEAKFFVIKSYSEDDVHKSIKYGVWASTVNGNKKLQSSYLESKEKPGDCPIFLLFSVNASGQFVGLAEMVGPVDFNKTVDYWQQEKWIGCFPVKWHIIKDVPNSSLRHIILENNENKPVTNSRDTQEVIFDKGNQILKIFKDHEGRTSILDDFGFYAARERIMQEKRAKQKIQKQVLDAKPNVDVTDDKANAIKGNESSLKSVNAALLEEPVGAASVEVEKKMNEEVKLIKENGSDAAVNSSPKGTKPVVPCENKVVPNVAASAC